MQYLVDTNIASAYFRREKMIVQRMTEIDYFVSFVVIGELYRWAFISNRKAERLAGIRNFARLSTVLTINESTSERFGIIAADLEQRGIPIPINDIWIAAQAIQYDLVLATREQHFQHVSDLKLEMW